jgi:hypothetical protein
VSDNEAEPEAASEYHESLVSPARRRPEGREVWVAETWQAHGYGHSVQGVYESREAAFEGLKDRPTMTVYVGKDQNLHGRPRSEAHPRAEWAIATPLKVQGRRPVPSPDASEEPREP